MFYFLIFNFVIILLIKRRTFDGTCKSYWWIWAGGDVLGSLPSGKFKTDLPMPISAAT